ncbi:MAG: cytochrome b/b6 domain-containing protein [Granulosicoccus sp.]|nr:cytochrome b/b6 domain-containing protein [Granulosicoccus sp.]
MIAPPSPVVFYSSLQRRLHWLVILLIAVQYLTQKPMREALQAIELQQSLGLYQFAITTIHTWVGACIALLMLWRWRLRRRPVPLNGGLMTQRRARWVTAHHLSLYVAVIVMALSGALHYYFSWSPAARWHELGKWLLLVLIAIHVLGALSHLGSASGVLQRMVGRDSLR